MFKSILFGVTLLTSTTLLGQQNFEVYKTSFTLEQQTMTLGGLQNISNDPGYDNQPSFGTTDLLLFAGNNQGQTDIFQLHSRLGRKLLWGGDLGGGEYSPQLIPNSNNIAAVRLDTTGLQRLYSYSKNGTSTLLIPDLKVAYYVFHDANTIVGSFIDPQENGLNLFVYKLDENKSNILLKNVGRSFHKVPGQDMVSYTAVNDQGNHDIYLLDMESYESFFVTQLPIGIQDYAWLDDSHLVLGSNDTLFTYDTFGDADWVKAIQIPEIKNITRVAVSPDGSNLAIAAEPVN